MEDRQESYDPQAERSVIGAMLLSPESAIDDVTEVLSANDFYSTKNREIFKAIVSVYNKDMPVDYITVEAELDKANMLEIIGGIEELIAISESVGSAINVRYYCDIIKEKSVTRELLSMANDVIEMGNTNKPVTEILEYAEKSVFDISQDQSHQDLTLVKDLLDPVIQKISEMSLNEDSVIGVPTGFKDLDMQLSGLQNSDLILLAARPAMGKTSLALNIAYNASVDNYVAFFSLEMSKMQLTQRLLSALSEIDLSDLVSGRFSDWKKLGQAANLLTENKLYVDDTSSINLNELRSKCRKLKARGELDLIIIDYLQLMTTTGYGENRQQEISAISRGLKGLAKELNCPILSLSQLSRAPDQRPNHRPVMSDLRESGAIEQDADIVLMLYRDDYYDENSENPNTAELIVAKHRNGPTGTINLVYDKEHTKFLDYTAYPESGVTFND
ncbi:MAG: replicative DNA helicase [Finegoldia sp.]|nr:replicative DNA helicase [Finegoldia sp.]